MTNYNELDQFLGKKEDRPYGNNTRVQRRGDKIAIKYHDTDIMLFSENEISMDCQGWRTSTTKTRLNDNLPSPWYVYQEKNQWYLRNGENTYVFEDGITIHLNMKTRYYMKDMITGEGKLSDVKKRQKLIRQINKYANDFVTEFVTGNIPEPSGGDCWGCLMKDENGKTALGSDHFLLHIEEKYYVPSLLMNAIDEFPISHAATWVIAEKWCNSQSAEFVYDIFKDQAKKSIVKYIKRQLKL